GRACFPSPFIASAVVATTALGRAESRRARDLLASLAMGERICTLALLEGSAGLDPGRLTGRKLFVPDAHVATDALVLASGPAGPTALLLPMDRAGKLFELVFADVEIRGDDLLGAPGKAWALLSPALRVGALARSAEMAGAAQRVLELCVEHAPVRAQGGRPTGAHQATH